MIYSPALTREEQIANNQRSFSETLFEVLWSDDLGSTWQLLECTSVEGWSRQALERAQRISPDSLFRFEAVSSEAHNALIGYGTNFTNRAKLEAFRSRVRELERRS